MRIRARAVLYRTVAITALISTGLVLPPAATAQQGSASAGESPYRAGSRALQFAVSQAFQLSSFRGSVLSYKVHRSEESAFRFGLSLSGSGQSDDRRRELPLDPQPSLTKEKTEGRDFSGGLSVQMLRYFVRDHRVRPFLAYGPGASYQRSRNTRESRGNTGDVSSNFVNEQKRRAFALSLDGLAGVEWLASSWMGLHAESGFSLSYNWDRSDSWLKIDQGGESPSQTTDKRREKTNYLKLAPVSARLGMSLYF